MPKGRHGVLLSLHNAEDGYTLLSAWQMTSEIGTAVLRRPGDRLFLVSTNERRVIKPFATLGKSGFTPGPSWSCRS